MTGKAMALTVALLPVLKTLTIFLKAITFNAVASQKLATVPH